MDKLENYWKLSEVEQRFNASQASVRALASAWLLAATGATGLLLKSEADFEWLLPVGLLVILIASLACAGLGVLWVMDQLVFHRLLNAAFLVGLRMEFMDATLPPIRAMMMKSAEGKGMHRWQKLFYVVPMIAFASVSLLVTLAGGHFTSAGAGELVPATYRAIGIVLLGGQAMLIGWVLYKTRTLSLTARAEMFGDDRFTEMVEQASFERVIGEFGRAE